ncbi:MAG TPA: winged helix-turn-helix transcriptional regulator [Nanoarchaeota archaeon]|nr:MAG: hypothetical protein QT09_C0012G0019 [archaeon GW2011_AR18]HIH25738.1 winged helix-turn-helix transcriptional regulator [Nanoarchaeota archaeon]
MAENKFILVNLEDTKSKELAQIISSDTARKILNILSDKPYSETDIAQKLNIPLTTVHYNIQHLLKAEVIDIKDFLWSEKGKKIQLYQLSNKLIIIAPKTTTTSFMEKLREIIPVALVGLLTSAGIYAYQLTNKLGLSKMQSTGTELLSDTSIGATQKAVVTSNFGPSAAASLFNEARAAPEALQSFNEAVQPTIDNTTIIQDTIAKEPNYALWFLLGVISVIVIYVVIQFIRSRRKK